MQDDKQSLKRNNVFSSDVNVFTSKTGLILVAIFG